MKGHLKLLAACLLVAALAACTNEVFEPVPSGFPAGDSTTVVTMRLQGSVTPFTADDGTTRAASDWQWQDGAVLYLQFYNGSERITGRAVYTKSTDSWEVRSWNGTIGTKDKCEVYFFQGASTSSQTSVTLGVGHAVYADKSASYVYENGDVTVSASLTPQTSRIRFLKATGTTVTDVRVEGVTYYSAYNATSNTFSKSNAAVSADITSTGYTNYFNCNFTDASKRQLIISSNAENFETQFSRSFGSNVLETGHSGYITIPTKDTNRGWGVTEPETTRTFTVNGNGKTVTFTMKRVEAGTFQMGGSDSNAYDDEKPVHSVTLTQGYYLGETEVTQALWYAVMGQKPTWSSSYGVGDNYPAYYISYEDCQTFLSSLNSKLSSQLLGMKFNFPTEAQWEYAARGGNKSQGYLYAGSNTIGDVAWYTDNSSSKTHEVKGKQANELGLYDMSGNVWEWCYDWYGSYSSGGQTNPTGPSSGSSRVLRGGGWFDVARACRSSLRGFNSPSLRNSHNGFRLALQ